MRRTTYSLDEQFEKMYANSMYSKGEDNRTDIKKMKAMVRSAIGYTLTKRQRECLTMYYFDHLKMRDQIGDLLSALTDAASSPADSASKEAPTKIRAQNILSHPAVRSALRFEILEG